MDAARCNCLALRQAARTVTQVYDRALAPAGLRSTQFPILALLERGPLAMKALASALVMDRATLGHNLRPIEQQGLIAITVAEDRRGRLVALTEAGRARLDAATYLWEAAQATFEDAFGAERAAALRDLLADVTSLNPARLEPVPWVRRTSRDGTP